MEETKKNKTPIIVTAILVVIASMAAIAAHLIRRNRFP